MTAHTRRAMWAATLAAASVLLAGCGAQAPGPSEAPSTSTAAPETTPAETMPATTTTATTASTEATTTTETTTTEPDPVVYDLTGAERDLVERVVMAEAGGEEPLGQQAVAQCILNAALLEGRTVAEIVLDYDYACSRPDPSEEVRQSVRAVFDEGARPLADGVVYFYAPGRCTSPWHESQAYACTIGGHKFFEAKEGKR